MSSSHEGPPSTSPRAMLSIGRLAIPRKLYTAIGVVIFLCTTLLIFRSANAEHSFASEHLTHELKHDSQITGRDVQPVAKYFIDYPLNGPDFGKVFGELGQRIQIVTTWLEQAEVRSEDFLLRGIVESATLSMFPFIRNPKKPNDPAVASLRHSYQKGSRGIVIPVGAKDFRYAYHLILNIRVVLGTILPIQIIYAGEDDLSKEFRAKILIMGAGVEFINILEVLDNEIMGLEKGWAIKPFAVLASTFEQVILLDADTVFLQKPETLFEHWGYKTTGALFFHDRLLWQHAFKERHDWWREQMKHQTPSSTLLKSKVWADDYAEEGDSGVVVLDKSRIPVFMGLLHICWQNTKAVREQITYKITYGDKESWWFGMELCGVPNAFEKHYGAVLGELRGSNDDGSKDGVCGFTIAHTDERDRLLWYNGSLLKNKAVNNTEFLIPDHWMVDGTWRKGIAKADMSCMSGASEVQLTAEETEIIERSIALAENADKEHSLL